MSEESPTAAALEAAAAQRAIADLETCEPESTGTVDEMIVGEFRQLRAVTEGDAPWLPPTLNDTQIRAIHLMVAERMRAAGGESLLWWEVQYAVEDFEELLLLDHRKEQDNEASRA